MTYQTRLLNFEGPLDLLLQLIDRSELEITDITLSSVTTQYLSYIDQLDNPSAGELQQFLDLAARLIYLKSLALLPSFASAEQDEDLAELADQLEQYRSYSKAATFLQDLIANSQGSWSRPVRESLPAHKTPLPKLELTALARVFQQEMQRLPVMPSSSLESQIDMNEASERIRKAFMEAPGMSLATLLTSASNRYEALVLFLAVLELIKTGEIAANQSAPHQEITLSHEIIRATPIS